MNKRKREKKPYEFYDIVSNGSPFRLHYNTNSKFVCRKQCDENPVLSAVKLEYIHSGTNKSCFYVVGEKRALLSACLRENIALNFSQEPHTAEFIDCSRSTHEVILESTEQRTCPVHLFLDMEIKRREFGGGDIPANIDTKLTPLIVRIVLDVLKGWLLNFDASMEQNVLMLTSTRPDQYSMHVIFKNIVFPSIGVLHAFIRELKEKTDNIPPFNVYSGRIIDFGIYRKETTLRMMHFGKSLTRDQWDSVRRIPRSNVNNYPLTPLHPLKFPGWVTDKVGEIIFASISMDDDALRTVNALPRLAISQKVREKRVSYKNKQAKNLDSTMELGPEGEDVLRQMYEHLTDMTYWPREMLTKAYRNLATEESVVMEGSKQPIYYFEYSDPDNGIPCFRDAKLFQPRCADPTMVQPPFDRHHNSPITLFVYANGDVKQWCWPHNDQEMYPFYVGNYLDRNNYNLKDSFDVPEKKEPVSLGINILN